MLKPKQALHSFTRMYQAKSAVATERAKVFGSFGAGLASANIIHEADAGLLQNIQAEYSISTIEELAALARIDSQYKTTLLQDIGITQDRAIQISKTISELPEGKLMLTEMERYEKLEYSFGCNLDFKKPPKRKNLLKPVSVAGRTFGSSLGAMSGPPPAGGGGLPAALPPTPNGVNLIDANMPPIRDQANRGTCVAFTSVACLEYYQGRFNNQVGLDLSEQFQFYNMVTSTGQRNLVSGFPLIQNSGVCREQTWPYYGTEIPPNDDQGPASATAIAEAPAFICRTVRQLPDPRSVEDIQQELSSKRLVGVGIPVYISWYRNGIVRQYGNITAPIPGEVPMQIGHAFTLVGYADDPEFAGGGYFIVRNSWGQNWATMGAFGPGYGTIPYKYITDYNWDAWCITA